MHKPLVLMLVLVALLLGTWMAVRRVAREPGSYVPVQPGPSEVTAPTPENLEATRVPAVTESESARAAASLPIAAPAQASEPALLGHVVAARDGSPVIGVTVELTFSDASAEPIRVLTDSQGRFAFAPTVPRALNGAHVLAGPISPSHRRAIDMALVPGGKAELELTVPEGLRITGTVVDAQDQPVPWAGVRAWCALEPDGDPQRTTTADGVGHFELQHLGLEFHVEAHAPEMAAVEVVQGRAGNMGRADGLVLRLAAIGELRARIVDSSRRPVLDAVLEVGLRQMYGTPALTPYEGIHRGRPASRSARSDAQGEIVLKGLPVEHLAAQVRHPDFAVWEGAATAGELLEVVLAQGSTVTGRVIAWDGNPAAGARVSLRQKELLASAVCDEAGVFRFARVTQGGNAWLGVRAGGNAVHVHEPVALKKDAPELEIVLSQARAIAGTLRRVDGTPAGDVAIRIEGDRIVQGEHGAPLDVSPTWEHFLLDATELRTAADGSFRFEQLYDGEFLLTTTIAGAPERRQAWTVRSGSEDLALVLDPDAANDVVLEGTVRDALTRAPIPRFAIIVLGYNRGGGTFNSPRHEFDSGEGKFQLGGLSPGQLAFIVQAEGYAQKGHGLVERGPGRHAVEVELSPTRSLHLRLVDPTGKPLAQANVWVLDANGRRRWVPLGPTGRVASLFTDAKGEVLFLDLPAERTKVEFQLVGDTSPRTHEQDLSVQPEGVVVVTVDPAESPKKSR